MHGHGAGETTIEEPNLVPLLDLVLQMVMFFMAVTNFAMENVNESIKLPLAQSAKPIEEVGTDILYMNVDHQGNLLVTRDNTYRDGKIDGMKGKQFDDNGISSRRACSIGRCATARSKRTLNASTRTTSW